MMPDILTRVHFFLEKEDILRASRCKADMVFRGHTIQLYQDLESIKMCRRQDFEIFMDKLRELNIHYQWGHPFALLFSWQEIHCAFYSLEEAKLLLGLESAVEDKNPSTSHLPNQEVLRPAWTGMKPNRSARRQNEEDS
ncbi:hypothetical protein NDU88_002529 [Pleurodeles waltl]|uniref:Uncharacterized protein n=1 Tax=Pleurodeles waltl TaxID=8319 RepID=A0AAV7U9Y7_PLEWA|nr:hypothetical protein NDU88_002529 [Pleurodeles waltl]